MRFAAGTLLVLMVASSRWTHAAPATVPKAGFDCARASSPPEKTVCADPALRALDARLATAYAAARHDARDRRRQVAAEAQWLRETRDTCSDAACLRRVYALRIDELTGRDPIAGVYDRAFGARSKDNHPGELVLRGLGASMYRLSGEALWISGANPENVHVGDVEATVIVRGGRFHMADEGDCRFDAELQRDVLHVTGSTPECGGFNVTFDGDYVRVAR